MDERDPRLSQAYREAEHPEPSPALDARILAAARQAVTSPPPRRRTGWFGWAAPLSTAAVLVLGIGLLFRMQQEAPETLREAALPPASPAAPAAALPPPESPDPESPDQAPRAVKPAPRRSELPPSAQPEAADSVAAVPEREAASEAPVLATQAVESKAMPAQADQARTAAPAPATNNLGAARADRAPAAAAAPALSPGMSKRKAVSAVDDSPEQRVEKIRRLLREGRIEEARKTLDELRDRYPAFVLPEDLSEARCCPAPQGKAE